MKVFLIVLVFFISFSSSYAYAGFNPIAGRGITSTIAEPKNNITKGLVIFYNQLITQFKKIITNITRKVQDPLLDLLTVFASGSIAFIVGKSFITGESLNQNLTFKLILFLALASLLMVDVFKSAILDNLLILFDNLPTIFSNTQDGNVVENIVAQTGSMIDTIKQQADNAGWGWGLIDKICATIAIAAITSMLIIVILNILECSFYFYITVGLGSIFILLFFFKETRNYSMGAVNLVVASILNVTILSFFLLIIGQIINGLLIYSDVFDLITNCISIIVICVLGDVLILRIKTITQTITAQGITTSTPSLNSIKDRSLKSIKDKLRNKFF